MGPREIDGTFSAGGPGVLDRNGATEDVGRGAVAGAEQQRSRDDREDGPGAEDDGDEGRNKFGPQRGPWHDHEWCG